MNLGHLGVDAHLAVFQATEVFMDSNLLGLRYQFLNHGAEADTWVASLHGAFSNNRSVETSNSSGVHTKSEVTTSQVGVSLGYKTQGIVPYFSYIYETHEVSTAVTNTAGNFGPYKDNGVHQYYVLGLSNYGKGFSFGVEYNHLQIKWDRASELPQDTLAFKFGGAW